MTNPKNTGTRDIPLRLTSKISSLVNEEWQSGAFINKVTPITKNLLNFWFLEVFCENRKYNFHIGQKQAILNTIYLHEILKIKDVSEIYQLVDDELLGQLNALELEKEKYKHPKYAIKMATGTGKTWIIQAIIIWQYLNAKNKHSDDLRFSKNFLLVAPGLIIYERLLNAFLGKEDLNHQRDYGKSDFKVFEQLFTPPEYREEIDGFINNAVCQKEEIGKKITGEGLIAITNWHLLSGLNNEEEVLSSPLEDPSKIVKELLPITPGVSAGHSLDSLDSAYYRGDELEYLAKLDNIVTINDEAHHIHENKIYGEVEEVEWQKSLNYISRGKGNKYVQFDFSATPYDVTGSGQTRTKHYFPHLIVDFDLKTAIHMGLVKTIVIDKRKELASEPLEFKAQRGANNQVTGLSNGQKIMLRAGLTKLQLLEKSFIELTKDKQGKSTKNPKMFVICEDTSVTPFVLDYLKTQEGLSEDEVVQIDSDKKGSIPIDEWNNLKQRLFEVDKFDKPKVIVSVMMLREGFDISNICVIVPLRSSQAPILMEQVVGRGLRLMWREPEYVEIKEQNRELVLKKKKDPLNYMDILSIIEHPVFLEFYDELIKDVTILESEPKSSTEIIGDLINVGLKDDYKEYDIFIPSIINEKEENIVDSVIDIEQMEPFTFYKLSQLKNMIKSDADKFYSEEITVKTQFGEYEVRADLFNAQSYNEYLSKLVQIITNNIAKVGPRKTKLFPVIQINQAGVAKALDEFICKKLFQEEFNPFIENNWRVLLLFQSKIIDHIVNEVSKVIYKMQNNIKVEEAVVFKKWFSDVDNLRMRESYCLNIVKTIYEKQSYPANKGGFERDFMEFCDSDSKVEAINKVNEHYHTFAHIGYVREDGIYANYSPDFIVKTKNKIYIIETKAQDHLSNENVKRKQIATVDFVNRINQLKNEDRMDREWNYVLLGEKTFRQMIKTGANIIDICEYVKITEIQATGRLF